MLASMDDVRLGLALKAARLRLRLRQSDLATQARVSATLVSRVEHGGADRISLRKLRAVAVKLGVSLEVVPRSAGGELSRVAGARHAALGELVAAWIARQPGWVVVAERSFSIYGERGVIDLFAWHETSCLVVTIELKTAIVDVNELIGTLDRKRRLAPRVAADLGWEARSVGAWLIVAESSTNRRRVAEHRTLLGSAFPLDGRSLAPLFLHPERGPGSGIAFWSDLPGVKVGRELAAPKRVVKPRQTPIGPDPRSEPLQRTRP
jgi:transcriptional regulator with XRE-family HTH domain